MELEDRVTALEAGLRHVAHKHAAVEWVVEQLAANILLEEPNADGFLDALARDDGRMHVAGGGDISADDRQAAYAAIRHLVEKIRTRVHQGPRQT